MRLWLFTVAAALALGAATPPAAAGDTTRVSLASDGTQGNSSSFEPALSGDGRYVAFYSHATNLDGTDANGTVPDVYVHDRQTGATIRVSVASGGTQGNGHSFEPALSGDGRYVAFYSHATNLDGTDANGTTADVYVTGIAVISDGDGDGMADGSDNCPLVANPDQADSDGDGIGDVCEPDSDGDGVIDDSDNCVADPNSNQADMDGDGVGDACDPDVDGDGIDNAADNCPFDRNSDQSDTDRDGAGDVCDADVDGDGVIDSADACVPTPAGEAVDADNGCSIGQLCPCGSEWKNQGAYQSCVARTSGAFVAGGLITQAEKDAIVSSAAKSQCGRKK